MNGLNVTEFNESYVFEMSSLRGVKISNRQASIIRVVCKNSISFFPSFSSGSG